LKIRTFSFKGEQRRLKAPIEENKHICPQPRGSTLQVKTFSFNQKETPEDPRSREQADICALNCERSNFQIKTFSFNKEETSEGHGRRGQAPKLCPLPRRLDFQVENQPLNVEIESEDVIFVHF